MTEPLCPHPESGVVVVRAMLTIVQWCPLCGSIRENNHDGAAPTGAWRAPDGIVLPGWKCPGCGAFCGAAKELLSECRACGVPRTKE